MKVVDFKAFLKASTKTSVKSIFKINDFMKRDTSIFQTPIFILSLTLLLLNDFWWKQIFHNSLTGKISDFAGLVVFPLFFTAFLPQFKKTIFSLLFYQLPFYTLTSIGQRPLFLNTIDFEQALFWGDSLFTWQKEVNSFSP